MHRMFQIKNAFVDIGVSPRIHLCILGKFQILVILWGTMTTRPPVGANETDATVSYQKGFLGKVSQVFFILS